ncbi:hypothetical protein TELCIR_02380 [Teladorsagia circumcincta]|uniref:Uncharacterized protein n=1 Tax=Teladorsagia circumcincta TaxID=45464 RepID=A0A2G9UZ82_TELCI|nr:hypothetical protein TELCIR_02380 [Teladorsagia circumcincta]
MHCISGVTCPGCLGYLHAFPYGKHRLVPTFLYALFSSDARAVWKELNRLASEGKWDNINNMPKLFLFGKAKKEAYALHHAIAGYSLYEFVVPEEKRLQYKYRNKHGHGEGHDHH